MSELINNAIKKIDDEMEKQKNNQMAKIIAEYVIDLIKNDDTASKILIKEKNLEKCIECIKNKAKKQAVNSMTIIIDSDVYTWVREYWGIEEVKKKAVIFNFDPLADL